MRPFGCIKHQEEMMLAQLAQPEVFSAHEYPVMSLAFSADGRWMASGDTNRMVKLWKDGNVLHSFDLRSGDEKVWPTERIRGMAFSSDSCRFFIASGDHLRSIELGSGEIDWEFVPRRRLCFLVVSPIAIALRPNGALLAATNAGKLLEWNPEGKFLRGWTEGECPTHLGLLADGTRWVGTDGYHIGVWDIGSGLKTQRLSSHERFYALATSPIENVIAVRTLHDVKMLDMDSMEIRLAIRVGIGLPLIAFSPDGSKLAVGAEHGIEIHSLREGSAERIELTDATLLSLAFNRSGSLAVGCSDHSIRIWPA